MFQITPCKSIKKAINEESKQLVMDSTKTLHIRARALLWSVELTYWEFIERFEIASDAEKKFILGDEYDTTDEVPFDEFAADYLYSFNIAGIFEDCENVLKYLTEVMGYELIPGNYFLKTSNQ